MHCRGFHARHDAHSTRMVNDRFRAASSYGFEMVDARAVRTFRAIVVINRKFTPNRIIAVLDEFSPTLPQWKHFRFIDDC
jgi:hypothetical protein